MNLVFKVFKYLDLGCVSEQPIPGQISESYCSARSIQFQGKLQDTDIKMTSVWKEKIFRVLLVED